MEQENEISILPVLDEIREEIKNLKKEIKGKKPPIPIHIMKRIVVIVVFQIKEINKSINEINGAISSLNKGIQKTELEYKNEINETNHIYLFGENSKLTFNKVILMIVLIVGVVTSIIYLPPFITDYNQMKQEKEVYRTFYEYMYLRQFEKHGSDGAQFVKELKKRIESNEESFVKEFNSLNEDFNKAVRIQQLKNELKSLE